MRIGLLALVAGLALGSGVVPAGAQSRTIVPQAQGSATQTGFYADSWAVVIGVNDYQHPRIPKLRYAVNDARAVERALLAQGFRRDRIITLLERQATKSAIERVLGDQLQGQMGPEDRLLVFFAGHGKTDRLRSGELEGYLLPADGDPGSLYSAAISMDALRRIADRLPAKHILYVVDACYSGYAIFNRSISEDLLEEMVRKPAIQILTAGRQGDEAQERGGHGVFTQVLLRGLQGDAFPGKGWVALEELGLWVKQRVFAESGKKQVPQYGNLSGEGQFVFLRPGGRPPKPGRLVITSTPGPAEVWLGSRKLGQTVWVGELAPGRHQIRVAREGYEDRLFDVLLGPNEAKSLDAQLKKWDLGDMVLVPAGEFWMGSALEGDADEKPRHRVHLDAFHIDKYEVTNAQFRAFVDGTSWEGGTGRAATGTSSSTSPPAGVGQ